MASIEAAGFDDIVVFAEPGSHTETSWNVVERPETIASPRWNLEKIEPLGVWRNYVQSLADLLVGFPDAEAIVLFQDDTVCCRGMRRLLEHELWPAHDAFVVSPYCPDSADFDLGGVDWTPFSSGRRPITDLIGACCFVYPRESAQMIVDHALSKTWRGHPRWRTRDLSKVKNLDGFIGAVVDALNTNFNVRRRGWKYRVYYANPSLVETIDRGGNSSLGHNDWKQNRGASRFVGEKTDAKNIFASCNPWYSVNLPDRTMRFPPRGPESPEPINIVIPFVNAFDLTAICLSGIARNTMCPVNVVLIDNGSETDALQEATIHAEHLGLPTVSRRFDRNMGFSFACNVGIDLSVARHVLLLNNDCRVGPGCVDMLKKHLEWHPRIGAANPLTGDRGRCSLRHKPLREYASYEPHSNETLPLDDEGLMARICSKQIVQVTDVLPFFCTMLHRDAIAAVGGLDAPRFPDGLAADDDWCIRAKRRGWRSLICFDAFAAHDHSETFRRLGLDRDRLQQIAARKL